MVTEIRAKYVSDQKFDFFDFGASKAASIEYAKRHLFGKKGLGIDLDEKRVGLMKKNGYQCVVADLTNIRLPAKCVKFVKMAHILEHVPDLKSVERVIDTAKKTATHFLVITGPYFDQDKYLRSLGFKLHWSDYPDHSCHLEVAQLIKILDKLKLNDYEIYLRFPITHSSSPHIHPLSSPSHSHQYNALTHPHKEQVSFKRYVWTDFVCYIRLKEIQNWDKITTAYKNQIPYLFNVKGVSHIFSTETTKLFVDFDKLIQEKDQTISDLKNREEQLFAKVTMLEGQISEIKQSRSWKLARKLQQGVALSKKPVRKLSRSGRNQYGH